MKRSALIVPGIAAALAAVIVALVGPSPIARAQSSPTFAADFATAADFYDRFDYGYSGVNPFDAGSAVIADYHGDHDDACQGPDTSRDVSFGGDKDNLDFSRLFWWCAPGGDPTKGHVMTGVDTLGYNHAWFAPKQMFTNVSKVCWDQNLTRESGRKWQELQFVDARPGADATRYPTGTELGGAGGEARGTGGVDLGYTAPGFRQDGPNTGLFPESGTLAGLKYRGGVFGWFQNQDTWTNEFAGHPGLLDADITDKATRYTHCLIDDESGTLHVTEDRPPEYGGPVTIDIPGDIPDWPVRVVFHDANYDPPKDGLYDENKVTWHWDNIQVTAESAADPPAPPPVVQHDAPASVAAPSAPSSAALHGDGGRVGRVLGAAALAGLFLLVAVAVLVVVVWRAGVASGRSRGLDEQPRPEPPPP